MLWLEKGCFADDDDDETARIVFNERESACD
jgi:hypothetical protein